MTTESDNQPTKWYKHTLFLILINIFGGIIDLLLAKAIISSRYILFGIILGIIYGGILSYTLWATTDNFSKSRAILISGLWGGLLGSIFLKDTLEYIILTGIGFPFLAYGLTFIILNSWSQVTSILSATMLGIASIYLLLFFIDASTVGRNAIVLLNSIRVWSIDL